MLLRVMSGVAYDAMQTGAARRVPDRACCSSLSITAAQGPGRRGSAMIRSARPVRSSYLPGTRRGSRQREEGAASAGLAAGAFRIAEWCHCQIQAASATVT